jgi:site-specific DNA recombinase
MRALFGTGKNAAIAVQGRQESYATYSAVGPAARGPSLRSPVEGDQAFEEELTLTGKIPCPQCGSKYIGTAAHGRNTRYRYYMCWSRNRYGAKQGCDIHRFNADELETAIGQALLDFYTTGHDVINQAVGEFVAAHDQNTGARRDELETVRRQLRDNATAVDRYLTAFEKGTIDDEDPDIQNRLTNLRMQAKQLRADKARLEFDLEQPPVGPSPADLALIRDHITEIIRGGDHKAKKALFEALIEAVEIRSDDSVVPTFRIPTAGNDQGLALEPALDQLPANDTVRVPPHVVDRMWQNPNHIPAAQGPIVTVTAVRRRVL